MTGFDGIPTDALDFYEELGAENTRTWWLAHKERYAASVREPLERLLDALEDEFGAARLYRPNRDVRFSADKSPYKDHQGALAATVPGMGFYLQVDAEGLMTGAGFYPTGPDQLPRLRAAIDAPRSGQQLQEVVDGLAAAGFDLAGDSVATRPRGVPADHPRLELMRFKTLIARREHGAPAWLTTPRRSSTSARTGARRARSSSGSPSTSARPPRRAAADRARAHRGEPRRQEATMAEGRQPYRTADGKEHEWFAATCSPTWCVGRGRPTTSSPADARGRPLLPGWLPRRHRDDPFVPSWRGSFHAISKVPRRHGDGAEVHHDRASLAPPAEDHTRSTAPVGDNRAR